MPTMAAAGEVLSRRALNRALLARQLLLERAELDPVTAIERLAGLQAQWPPSPYIALWSRLRDFRVEDLEAALIEGRVVKSNLMRVTLHLVSTADFQLYRTAIETETQSGSSGSAAAAGESLAAIRAELVARAAAGPLPRAGALPAQVGQPPARLPAADAGHQRRAPQGRHPQERRRDGDVHDRRLRGRDLGDEPEARSRHACADALRQGRQTACGGARGRGR